ncbi:hypothetical protein Tsubulata_027054 [Turnera subulata]|uniref:EGF-like domain-containing protein n=1 Tax=Turnera subulata TaxID=218843 RepID=A0A9Q0FVK7_9ROSI|nr:hypothetical protein Tsubulata_027054 [Turnera subulata]
MYVLRFNPCKATVFLLFSSQRVCFSQEQKRKKIMAENWILCPSSYSILSILCLLFSSLFGFSCSINELGPYNTFTVSSFRYPEARVKPFDLRYIRVDLPPWFSSLSIAIESDVELNTGSISKLAASTLPLVCFRDGSPPLPDVLNSSLVELGSLSNASFEGIQSPQNVQCYLLQKNITLTFTNEQIVRSPAYSFSANISVEGCTTSMMWGEYCNQTIQPLLCSPSDSSNLAEKTSVANFSTSGNKISCKNFQTSCHREGEPKIYSLEVTGIAAELKITVSNVGFSTNDTINARTTLMCFVRHGALPSLAVHDYSGDISKSSLVIQLPKIGRWFITILPANLSTKIGVIQNTANLQVCYSIDLQMLECPLGKAGQNCTYEIYTLQILLCNGCSTIPYNLPIEAGSLQTFLRRDSSLFESYYLPVKGTVSSDSANFPLEPLSSNSSFAGELDNSWTFFILNIPRGAAGGNIHIHMTSDATINYEVYARFGGLPSLESWDYCYANRTSNSHDSMFFKLYNSSKALVDFYILYVKEGTWTFGLRNLNTSSSSNGQTLMSVSVERCPKRCSSHGECKAALDASGLTSFSFCSCDRTHGGFDCSIEVVSHQGHIWQSVALIASNAAAILPAYWALRQKAFAEWVLFTSSGISSGLYHACDVGTWCALSFNVLQFMDFWLSFMAVVSTFVYLTTIDESSKRTIHTVVAILTALMAITKATRSSNIILVIAIGALGLLVGWLIEFSANIGSFSFSRGFCLNMLTRWHTVKAWLKSLIKTLLRRFRWGFVLMGFAALAMAAISWNLESSESYWIWHSVWHVSIYTSSFFFLCSKANIVISDDQSPQEGRYDLTRQDSFSGVE